MSDRKCTKSSFQVTPQLLLLSVYVSAAGLCDYTKTQSNHSVRVSSRLSKLDERAALPGGHSAEVTLQFQTKKALWIIITNIHNQSATEAKQEINRTNQQSLDAEVMSEEHTSTDDCAQTIS